MTDIFFSYSSADRERVRPVRDALVAQGFEVFWDQEVPTGLDWDSWIRQHLAKGKCAMAFWSVASVASDNVRHEAVVAKQQGKLISVLLESLTAQQFPMGLYAQQAANLADWNGDPNHKEWRKLRREYEAKLIPTWVRQQLDELEAELVGERARREGVERRDKTLQAQIAKEAQAHQDLKREFDKSLDEVATAKANVVELSQRLSEANARVSSSARRIEVAKSAARAALFTQNPIMQFGSIAAVVATLGFWTYHLVGSASSPTASEQGSVEQASLLPVAIVDEARRKVEEAEQFRKEAERQANLAADADAKRQAAETEQQRLKDEVQRQTKAAVEVEAKLQVAQAEQQRQSKSAAEAQTKLQGAQAELQIQAKAAKDADDNRKCTEAEQQQLKLEVQRLTKGATDSDTKRRDAEAEQQRLKVEVQRQIKAAADADTARKAAEAEQQRLTEELRKVKAEAAIKQVALPQATTTVMPPSFESRPNVVVRDAATVVERGMTVAACQDKCAQLSSCAAFTFNKTSKACYLYNAVSRFEPDADFDSGVRQSLQASVQSGTPQPPAQQAATLPAANQPASTRATGLFTIHINTEVGRNVGAEYSADAESIDDCEKMCTARSRCKLFSYNKTAKKCDQYFSAGLTPNTQFDSGVRK